MKNIVFLGRSWPPAASVFRILNFIKGIGIFRARQILRLTGFSFSSRALRFTAVKRSALLEKTLHKCVRRYGKAVNIHRFHILDHLRKLGSYRTFRHREGLPVRGQRTHSNARTSKRKKNK